jgi:hypothetical protein
VVKRRQEQLRKAINSLSCLPSTELRTTHPLPSTISSLLLTTMKDLPWSHHQMKPPDDRYSGWQFIPLILSEPSLCLTPATKQTTATKNEKEGGKSYMSQCKSFAMTIKWEMPPRTSSTHLLGQYVAMSSSQDNTIKPHKASPQDKSSSMASFRSMETTLVCTPLTTLMATLQLHRPLSMWTNHLRSETLKYWWPHLQN